MDWSDIQMVSVLLILEITQKHIFEIVSSIYFYNWNIFLQPFFTAHVIWVINVLQT